MANQSNGEKLYVVERRDSCYDCDTDSTREEVSRDVATWRATAAYLIFDAFVEDTGTDTFSSTEYVVYAHSQEGCKARRQVRIEGFDGGFRVVLEEGGVVKDTARFDKDYKDKDDLAIRIINLLDEEDD